MTQDELWQTKWLEVITFIESNRRNPSKHSDEERGKYLNWFKHNKKLYSVGLLKKDKLEEYAKVVMRTRDEIKQWIRDEASDEVKRLFGIR